MDIPKNLVDAIRDAQVVLFLGAGASIGAIHPMNKQLPDAQKLSEMICDKFLTKEYRGWSLSQVAELAISETNLFTVQQFIASIFQEYRPSEFHKLIPKFVWVAIATTNYDLIIERAYEEVKASLQQIVPIKKNGERIEEKLRSPQNILYFKLHGCVTDINDENVPLILTPDQYVTHRKGRSRLFERILDLAREYTFVFVGHSLNDFDLRAILLELAQLGEAKPRSYLIAPNFGSAEERFWANRRMSCIKCTFEDFLKTVNEAIPASFRGLAVVQEQPEHPVQKRFAVAGRVKPSESLITFLMRDAEYISKDLKIHESDPRTFYRGYFPDLGPIINGFDVRRVISDDILSEVFLTTEEERIEKQQLFLLKGHAGSGKSVLLRRLAWEAASQFDKLCFLVKPFSHLEYEPIYELCSLTKERIFLFIDPASDNKDIIVSLMVRARKDKIPITIFSAERHNEWNTECEELEPYLTQSYELKYLSDKEIDELIGVLARHSSLGYLANKSLPEQRQAFSKRAGRQLLVALHEATLGKPFADIVLDEYKSIASPQAQSLYLTVCILHRLRVSTRAGLISRVHGIPFNIFKERLFEPLEFVVFATMNSLIRDYVYLSRHPHIAEIVFERVLVDTEEKYNEYMRIINALDIDYDADRAAFKMMTNSKHLVEIFKNADLIRQIYKNARDRSPDDPIVLQQEAIFEMNTPGGSLERATELLQRARNKMPRNMSIAHSLAELSLKKAAQTSNPIEKNKYRKESQALSRTIVANNPVAPHALHTLAKIGIDELEDVMQEGDPITIERKIAEVEKFLNGALQQYPDSSYLLDAESMLNKLIEKFPQALAALKKAFSQNNRSAYVASRLAKMYEHMGQKEDAVKVLKECLDANPQDKDINFKLGMMLANMLGSNEDEVKYHLRHSFTKGDNRHHAQFWYARMLYLAGEFEEANDLFGDLREANIDERLKKKARGKVTKDGIAVKFSGVIRRVEASYGFIIRDGYGDRVFVYRHTGHKCRWDDLKMQRRVIFEMSFTYRGPIAIEISLES